MGSETKTRNSVSRVAIALIGVILAAVTWMALMQTKIDMRGFEGLPLRTVTIVVPAESRPQFLLRMRKFANEQGFNEKIRSINSTSPQFAIDLWRDDLGIFGDNLRTEQAFEFGLYGNTNNPVPSSIDRSAASLSKAASEVPGVRELNK